MRQPVAAAGGGVTEHRATLDWLGVTALAFGGANQALFLIDGLIGGQNGIAGQGGAAMLLLASGFLLACLAAPGWLELVLLSPDRVGGIGAACGTAFRPYSPMLGALAGFCIWWGWAATCGLAATTIAALLGPLLPGVPPWLLACGLIAALTALALRGLPASIATACVLAAIVTAIALWSVLAPLLGGATAVAHLRDLRLTVPFAGSFGRFSAVMAGLFVVGYAAPCFEAALCYVGEMADPVRQAPRALWATMVVGCVFFIVLPLAWVCAAGAGQSLMTGRLWAALSSAMAATLPCAA